MPRKGLRRLDLWLPDNHPIWFFPPGTRAPVAKAYLDLLSVELAQSQLLEEILRRLERLEEKLASSGLHPARREAQGQDQEFDVAGFFGAFDAD